MAQLVDPAIGHWDFPRAVAGTCLLLRFAASHGIHPRDALTGSGLNPGDLEDPTAVVQARQELQVVRNIAAVLPDGGLEAGRHYHATTFGILGFAFISSRTVADAMNFALRYLDLSFTFSIPRASIVHGKVVMELDDTALPEDLARFLVERDLMAIHTVIGELLPGGVPLDTLEFRFTKPSTVEQYPRAFGVAPAFGGPRNQASFDAVHLGRPLPQANAQTVAMCDAQCRDLVSRRRGRTGVAHDVRTALTRFGALSKSMPDIAAELAMSERTLRRKLDDAGTTFRALLDEVREVLAEELLTAMPVDDVATRLGYAEASSFIHAFKRWKGVTPATYTKARRPA
jgi:AraC-like DNA-binding protein